MLILHPMTPFFYSVHTQWPPFSTFVSNVTYKSQIFCTLCRHFGKFNNFLAVLAFWLEIAFLHTEWPPFSGVHTKKDPIFLVPTPNDPFFWRNFTPDAPCFHSPVGTCTSLSYLCTLQRKQKNFLSLTGIFEVLKINSGACNVWCQIDFLH